MTTMILAVANANLIRSEFQFRIVRNESKVKWPRKRFNKTVGVRKEIATGKITGKVN